MNYEIEAIDAYAVECESIDMAKDLEKMFPVAFRRNYVVYIVPPPGIKMITLGRIIDQYIISQRQEVEK